MKGLSFSTEIGVATISDQAFESIVVQYCIFKYVYMCSMYV